jgi:DDE family transposase
MIPPSAPQHGHGQGPRVSTRSRCTRSQDNARHVTFPPHRQQQAQQRLRAEQATDDWRQRYVLRCGVESLISQASRLCDFQLPVPTEDLAGLVLGVLADRIGDHLTRLRGGRVHQPLRVVPRQLPPGEDVEVGACRDRL